MSDADAVARLRQQHIDAFNQADVETMAQTAADDLVIMAPNQPAVAGKDAARAWWQEGFAAANSHFGATAREIEVAGQWAFDRFDWTMETTPKGGGEASRDSGNCVWISRRGADGSWLLARAIWNSDQAPGTIWSGEPRS